MNNLFLTRENKSICIFANYNNIAIKNNTFGVTLVNTYVEYCIQYYLLLLRASIIIHNN